MKRCLTLAAAVLAGALLAASPVRADPIGTEENPCGNDSCFGNIFTIGFFEVSATHFNVFVTVDTSGYNGAGTFLSDLAIKLVAQDDHYTSTALTNAPGGAGGWTLQDGNLAATGCGGSGNGWLCVSGGSVALTPVPGGTYTFVFDLEVGSATNWLFDSASIQARYGIRGNLTSEDITMQRCESVEDCPPDQPDIPVPEPGTLLLLGLGLVALAVRRRPAG